MVIDASDIEAQNQEHLDASTQAQTNLRFCGAAIDFLKVSAELHELISEDDISLRRLAIRLINSAGAAGKCALAGFYQPAVANIRDIVEIAFLVDLFRHVPAEVERWRSVEEVVRKKEFRPVHIRGRLAKIDPENDGIRKAAYEFYSKNGTHVHPYYMGMISPNDMTVVGPFPDQQRITLITFDLAKYLGMATGCIARLIGVSGISDNERKLAYAKQKLAYANAMTAWRLHAEKITRTE